MIAYNPLAGGFLDRALPATRSAAGRARASPSARPAISTANATGKQAQLEAVQAICRSLQAGAANRSLQVAVAWVLAQPGVTSAIVGASKAEHLDESLAAVNVTLEPEEKQACNLAWFSLPCAGAPVQ